ncbi:replication initiation factor domain-containing protein [Brevibacillus daliensis]|uniref:replication initiation factor domain-containing protein n=1 Tax=Brevibacillus daliensis TaxID=2892995 RepID=UPI001E2892D9|nr:replication initiation factor domain-containing protein [Brevibacillus daliensis]
MTTEVREIIERNVVPPTTNRGAQNTDESGMRALIDWLQGTCIHANSLREIIDILGIPFGSFRHEFKGAYGWDESLWLDNMRIYFGGTKQRGFHIYFPGQACRDLEQHTNRPWIDILKDLKRLGTSFSRVDGAIDDFGVSPKRKRGGASRKPRFTVGTLIRKAKDGVCSSKFEYAKAIEKIKIATGEEQGQSIYYGSPSSRIHMVCYEKYWERLTKGYDLEDGIEKWNRFEVRYRDERADQFVEQIISSGKPVGEIIAGTIKNYVTYRDRDEKDSNKSRWKVSRFWKNFLGDVEKIQLATSAPDKTLMRTDKYWNEQLLTTAAKMYIAKGEEALIADIRKGVEKLKDSDYMVISRDYEDYNKLIQARKIVEFDKFRTGKLEALHKKGYLDEVGRMEQDYVDMTCRKQYEDFVKEYDGDSLSFTSELAKMRLEKFNERRENKNARYAIGSDQGTEY